MTTSTLGPLASLSFGQDVAEHDDRLESYFLTTGTYWAVVHDEADVVLGAKGTGKSAIARYIANDAIPIPTLRDVLVIPAFNIRGSVLFRRLTEASEPADEGAYRDLFMAYMAGLAANHLVQLYGDTNDSEALRQELERTGLCVNKREVHSIWRKALDRLRPRIETTLTFEDGTEGEPLPPQTPLSLSRIEALLDEIYNFAERVGIRCWVVFDRLDEAFADNRLIEVAALRGLLRASLDISSLGNRFRVKLFLRLDIFERITESAGFVNATHLRLKRITWDSDSIHHLVALRLQAWDRRAGLATPDNALASPIARRRYCRRILPRGLDGFDPLVWLLLVTVDGTREYNPRNVITLLRNAQLEEIQIGARDGQDPETRPALLSVKAMYSGYRQLSVARLNDTLYAENAIAREYVPKFRGKQTTYTLADLENRLGISGNELSRILSHLTYSGFLRMDGEQYLLPALYRPALFASTHGAELVIGIQDIPAPDLTRIQEDPQPEFDDDSASKEAEVAPANEDDFQSRLPRAKTRSRGRRVRRRGGSGRDEFIPTGAQSEVVDESSFAAQIESELSIDSSEFSDFGVAPSSMHRSPDEGTDVEHRLADTKPTVGGEAVGEARRLGEQGDAAGGFMLLYPKFTVHPGAACVAADLAYQSADADLITLARSVLAKHGEHGAVSGRAAALAAYANDDLAVVSIVGRLAKPQIQSFVIGLVRMISLAPEREAGFWRVLINSYWRDISSAYTRNIWAVLAASRILPICRFSWESGAGGEVGFLGVSGVRDMIWDSGHWTADLPNIVAWATQYARADEPTAAIPALLPYQVLSCAAVLDSVGALDNHVRTRLLQQLSGQVGAAEKEHRARFSDWSQFTPLALEVLDGDYGSPKATSAHRAKSVAKLGRVERPTHPSHKEPIQGTPRISRTDVVLLMRTLEQEQVAKTSRQILLAILGSRLRRVESGFDFRSRGFSTLLAWVTACAELDSRIRIARTELGHPYVWVSSSEGEDSETNASN